MTEVYVVWRTKKRSVIRKGLLLCMTVADPDTVWVQFENDIEETVFKGSVYKTYEAAKVALGGQI